MACSFDGAVMFGWPSLSKVHARRSITSEVMRMIRESVQRFPDKIMRQQEI
ncbi:hypothetical protein ACU4GH_27380 [Bradyrhizobium betae]